MKRLNVFKSLVVLFVFSLMVWGLVPSEVEGAVPQLINFQGILKDGSGNPVADGSYSVTFTVYDAPAGGAVHWAETTSVSTTDGLFSILLGSLNPVPESLFHNPSRYLGIKVATDPEMTPRQQLSSVGYSYVSSQWTSAGQNLFRLNGKVGIGTTSPTKKLEVAGSIKVGTNDTVFSSNVSSNSPLQLQAPAGTTRMFISDGNGNVGVGTMTPIGRLHIKGPSSDPNKPVLEVENSLDSWYSIQLKRAPDTAFDYFIGRAPSGTLSGRALGLHVPTAANQYGGIGAQPKIAFLSSGNDILGTTEASTGNWYFKGNVGIGTTSPSAKLDVTGGYIRARDNGTNNTPTSGKGLELIATGSVGDIISYDRDLGIYLPLVLASSTLELQIGNVGTALYLNASGNVGIGTTSPGASNLLELSSTTKGFVLPRMTKAQRDAIASPVAGMMVYQTDNTPGLRVYNGTNWMRFTETAD